MNLYHPKNPVFPEFIKIINSIKTSPLILFECGVHDGSDTHDLITLCKENKKDYIYYAFEADPRIVKSFAQHTKDLENIYFISKAITSYTGKVSFYLSGGQNKETGQTYPASSSIKKESEGHRKVYPSMTFEQITVDCVSVDDFCKENSIPYIDFFYCDMEGAEIDFLRGSKNMINKFKYYYTETVSQEKLQFGMEGQISIDDIIKILGQDWEIVKRYDYDVLFKNKNFK